jgi:nitroreductase
MMFDLATTDALLATTRAVRRRLDFDRPVPRDVILECIALAAQAPTGGNSQGWRWVVVDEPAKKAALADIYRACAGDFLTSAAEKAEAAGDAQTARVYRSAAWFAGVLEQAPALVIPCMAARPRADAGPAQLASHYGSIFPAVWSFQLALRARGLGSVLTTLHLGKEAEAAAVLGLPAEVQQIAMLPVGYTRGTDFKPAARPPVERIVHWNGW